MTHSLFWRIDGWFDSAYDASRCYSKQQFFASITVKKRILDKKLDMIDLLSKELVTFGIEEWTLKKLKQRVEFGIPVTSTREAHYEYAKCMRQHLSKCIDEKWGKQVVFEKDTLQALLMEKLKKPEFRLHAAIHHSERHGAQDTLDLVDLIDREWSLRY